jgi:CSLREA domain-containing protein
LALLEFRGTDAFPGQGILVISDNNRIEGNFVGPGVDGITRSLNTHGIQVQGSDNTVGGTTPGARNLISANNRAGLFINGGAGGNFAQGNIIGLDRDGVGVNGSGRDGISIVDSPNNVIGGTDPNARNVVSNNAFNGIVVANALSTGNVLQGNFVGTDVTGTVDVGNMFHGVLIFQAPGNTVGGSAPGARNVCSGNTFAGVVLDQSSGCTVQGNILGSDPAGALAIGNGFSGLLILNSSNTIATNNLSAFNATGGVVIAEAGTGNRVQSNAIFSNTGLGIDLALVLGPFGVGDGVTPNDAGDADGGTNNLQNFPVLSGADLNSNLEVTYAVDSSAANAAYPLAIEFFLADPAGQEGRTLIGTDTYNDGDGTTVASFSPMATVVPGNSIVATATDTAGNTSEFSASIAVGGGVLPNVIFVNSTGDADDQNPFDGVCSTGNTVDGQPECTLRAAITHANAAANLDANTPDEIRFAIPPADPNHLYYRNDNVPGQVSLAEIATTAAADDTTIGDIDPDHPHSFYRIAPATLLPEVTGALIIDGFTQPGALANINPAGQGLNARLQVQVDADLLGDTPDGVFRISAGDSTVRGLNVSRFSGVAIALVEEGGNHVEGNFLGTDISGTIKFPDPTGPITIIDRAAVLALSSDNVVGGTSAAQRNLIAGLFRASAALLSGNRNLVQGNLIGTDRSGTTRLENTLEFAVVITGGDNSVGGAIPQAGNVISGSYGGVSIRQTFGQNPPPATGNLIAFNVIGSDVTGSQDLGNVFTGIEILAADNTVQQNLIAFNEVGIEIGIPTGGMGQSSEPSAGPSAGPYDGNLITQNSMFGNLRLGIDLDANGLNFPQDNNDADTGGNALQNFPRFTAVTDLGPGTRVEGFLQSTPSTGHRLEFFASDARDPSGFGEGRTYLGSADVNTDGAGRANFSADLPAAPGGQPFISATATDIDANNTSEFSPAFPVDGCLDTVVVNSSDGGTGSLREAIYCSMDLPGTDTVSFNIPGAGPHDITMLSPFPDIVEPVIIDGFTQPGAAPNTNPVGQGLNSAMQIVVHGLDRGPQGFVIPAMVISAGDSTVRGLVLNDNGAGPFLEILDRGNNVVAGNFIGTNAVGFGAVRNDDGVHLRFSHGNRIGGTDPADRNLISGAESFGLDIEDSDGNTIQGNLIGTGANGVSFLGNRASGLNLSDSSDNLIGGTTLAGANIIGWNLGNGIAIGEDCEDNRIHGNFIGTDPGATLDIGNFAAGVQIGGGVGNRVGGLAPGEGNVIAHNARGVYLPVLLFGGFGREVPILGNRIFASDLLGIDLRGGVEDAFGVTANDLGSPPDADANAPNSLQNYPVLTDFMLGSLSITGELQSTPSRMFRIDFYLSDFPDHSLHGEGGVPIGAVEVTTDANGFAAISADFPTVTPTGAQAVTATATLLDEFGDPVETSEFSAALTFCEPEEVVDFVLGRTVTPPDCADANGDGLIDSADVATFHIRR